MILVDTNSSDVFFNMAAEEYLLKKSKEDYILLYRDDPCVVVGKHQRVCDETDTEMLKNQGISLARRYSGGGAVYHDSGNLNVSFIETYGDEAAFGRFTGVIRDFLATLGVDAVADGRNSLFVGGKKISGSAQCIYGHRLMYHATLLFSVDLEMLVRSLKTAAECADNSGRTGRKTWVRSRRSEVTNLAGLTGEHIGIEEFANRLKIYLTTAFAPVVERGLDETETREIMRLRDNKYITDNWNLKALGK